MAIKITRIDPVSKKRKEYNSYEEAALEVGRTSKSIYVAVSKKRLCAGYYWEKKGTDKTFEDWMIKYIKENYKGEKSLSSIAVAIGRGTEQVKRKVEYLGLKEYKPKEETDQKFIDAKSYKSKIEEIKQKVCRGKKVRIEIYAEDLEDGGNKSRREIEVEVKGAYRTFFNVLINGREESYYYDEILQVIG